MLSDPTLLVEAARVGDRWIPGGDDAVEVRNPSTGELVGRVPSLGADETRVAIEAAEIARHAWAARAAKDRAGILRRWFELIAENSGDLVAILTMEQGKPLTEARGEILYGASFIEWFAEEARRIYGDVVPGHTPDKRIVVLKQPIGVVGAITPWNFQNAMIPERPVTDLRQAAPWY